MICDKVYIYLGIWTNWLFTSVLSSLHLLAGTLLFRFSCFPHMPAHCGLLAELAGVSPCCSIPLIPSLEKLLLTLLRLALPSLSPPSLLSIAHSLQSRSDTFWCRRTPALHMTIPVHVWPVIKGSQTPTIPSQMGEHKKAPKRRATSLEKEKGNK